MKEEDREAAIAAYEREANVSSGGRISTTPRLPPCFGDSISPAAGSTAAGTLASLQGLVAPNVRRRSIDAAGTSGSGIEPPSSPPERRGSVDSGSGGSPPLSPAQRIKQHREGSAGEEEGLLESLEESLSLGGGGSPDSDALDGVEEMIRLGFDRADAVEALTETGGDRDAALRLACYHTT